MSRFESEFSRDGSWFAIDGKRVTSDEWFSEFTRRVGEPQPSACARCGNERHLLIYDPLNRRYDKVPCPSCTSPDPAP